MHPVTIKSFRRKDGEITLYEDAEGKEPVIILPVWMFNQMIETFYDVEIK